MAADVAPHEQPSLCLFSQKEQERLPSLLSSFGRNVKNM